MKQAMIKLSLILSAISSLNRAPACCLYRSAFYRADALFSAFQLYCRTGRNKPIFNTMQVLISNRQRQMKLNQAEIESMASALSDEVLDNLINKPAGQISRSTLSQLKQRALLSLVFLSNNGIAKINKRWRNKSAETVVLSFPLDLNEPGNGMPWELGEIFISIEKASEQAVQHNHGLKRELAFLFVHGMLHILGFDHEDPEDEKIMFARQRSILQAAGYPRR